jgi:polysaccharide biosynthesis protein PslG
MKRGLLHFSIGCLCILALHPSALEATSSTNLSEYQYIGKLRTKSSNQIASSCWGVTIQAYHGGEEFRQASWLGIKWARILFNWRDGKDTVESYERYEEYVDRYLAAGIKPIFTVYVMLSDPETGLIPGNEIIQRPDGLARYVTFLQEGVAHFKNRVQHWEIWNEPNTRYFWHGPIGPGDYARLAKVIASAIKRSDPDAKVAVGAFAGVPIAYIQEFFNASPGHDFDAVSFHPYGTTPEELDPNLSQLIDMTRKYSANDIQLWATESGYPSTPNSADWTGSGPWTEDLQAVWLLRRLLCNYGLGTKINLYYTLVDIPDLTIDHGGKKGEKGTDTSGLLDTAYGEKEAFRAYQNLASLLDDRFIVMKADVQIESSEKPSVKPRIVPFGSNNKLAGLAVWLPVKLGVEETVKCDIVLHGTTIDSPVLLDPMTGKAYLETKRLQGQDTVFANIPVSQVPLFLIDLKIIEVTIPNTSNEGSPRDEAMGGEGHRSLR